MVGKDVRRGFTLIELMIVIAIIAIIAAIAIPGILSATRSANERNASSSLKSIVSAQLIFKGSDTDNNGLNDFWTADIKGLYFIASGTPTPIPIRMIEVSIAQADGNPDPQSDYTNPAVGVLPAAATDRGETLVRLVQTLAAEAMQAQMPPSLRELHLSFTDARRRNEEAQKIGKTTTRRRSLMDELRSRENYLRSLADWLEKQPWMECDDESVRRAIATTGGIAVSKVKL